MRSDMSTVVIERPRARARYNYHDHRVRCGKYDIEALDDLPKKQGYRRPYIENHGDCKELADLIGPLRRYLVSKVGENWDDIYSEIRENLNPNSTTQIHILSHVFDFVQENTWIGADGEIWTCGGNRFRNYTGGAPYHVSHGDLYVHPNNRVLCEMPVRAAYKKHSGFREAVEKLTEMFGNHWHKVIPSYIADYHQRVVDAAKNHLRVGLEHEYHKMNGIWYRVGFADVPPPFTRKWTDSLGRVWESAQHFEGRDIITGLVHKSGRYRASRYQASRRELRRYGLWND